jgi:two-component system, LytTR family, response regulator
MNPIKVIIADDERLARDYIRQLLAGYVNMVIIDECKNGLDTVNAVFSKQPDLIFLDIQMPDLNGFEVIQEIKKEMKMPFIIFTTAYEQFALRAFEVSATDYLLKPFTENRFDEAVKKAIDQLEKNKLSETTAAVEALLRLYNQKKQEKELEVYPSRILVKTNKRMLFVNTDDIYWLEASGDYVKINLKSNNYLINESLSNFEKTLDPDIFIRVHRSHIVNVNFITEFKPYFNGEYILVMGNGQEVKLSRSYKDKIKTLLGKDFI